MLKLLVVALLVALFAETAGAQTELPACSTLERAVERRCQANPKPQDALTRGTEGFVVNSGFMPNPPASLIARFPMCEAFLKVTWLNRNKQIGYVIYDALMKLGESANFEKKHSSSLVDLKSSRFDFDVSRYEEQGRLQDIFKAVKEGNVKVDTAMWIKHGQDTFRLDTGANVNDDAIHPLLTDYRKTVCLVYPDGLKAWIIEGRSVNHAYSDEQKEMLTRNLQSVAPTPRKLLDSFWVLDINRDGEDDYLSQRSLIYSSMGRLYISAKERDRSARYTIFTFPPSNVVCRLYGHWDLSPLVTDGERYFLGDKCDLTHLTSPVQN